MARELTGGHGSHQLQPFWQLWAIRPAPPWPNTQLEDWAEGQYQAYGPMLAVLCSHFRSHIWSHIWSFNQSQYGAISEVYLEPCLEPVCGTWPESHYKLGSSKGATWKQVTRLRKPPVLFNAIPVIVVHMQRYTLSWSMDAHSLQEGSDHNTGLTAVRLASTHNPVPALGKVAC